MSGARATAAFALVDTDILIDVSRGEEAAIAYLERLEQQVPFATNVVTQMELIVGCRKRRSCTS